MPDPDPRATSVFKTEWFSIDAVPHNSRDRKPYYRVSCSDAVEILTLNEDKKIILVRQFRPAIGAHLLEFPSGYIDEGETPRQAVRRELREEAGHSCGPLVSMGYFHVAPSRFNNKVVVFFASGARMIPRKKREHGTEIVLTTERNFNNMIRSGGIISVSSVAFYYLAKVKGLL